MNGIHRDEVSKRQSELDENYQIIKEYFTNLKKKKLLLKSKELKKAEVIEELLITELNQLQKISTLLDKFLDPIRSSKLIPIENLNIISSNISEILEIHENVIRDVRASVECGSISVDYLTIFEKMFSGCDYENVKRNYENLYVNFEKMLEKFNEFSADKNKFERICGDATKDSYGELLESIHQRITKYPLLFESINKNVPLSDETVRLRKLIETSKKMLREINSTVEEFMNFKTLNTVMNNLENRTKYDIDLSDHLLLLDGMVKISTKKGKQQEFYSILTDKILAYFLSKDGKYLLEEIQNFALLENQSRMTMIPMILVKNIQSVLKSSNDEKSYVIKFNHNNEYDLSLCVSNDSVLECSRWIKKLESITMAKEQNYIRTNRVDFVSSDEKYINSDEKSFKRFNAQNQSNTSLQESNFEKLEMDIRKSKSLPDMLNFMEKSYPLEHLQNILSKLPDPTLENEQLASGSKSSSFTASTMDRSDHVNINGRSKIFHHAIEIYRYACRIQMRSEGLNDEILKNESAILLNIVKSMLVNIMNSNEVNDTLSLNLSSEESHNNPSTVIKFDSSDV